MKKILGTIIIFLIFLIVYFIQVNLFNWFNIAGIKPNLILIMVVFLSIYIGKYYGFSIGVITGLLIDIFVGQTIGLNAIALGTIGFLAGIIIKNITRRKQNNINFNSNGIKFFI